MSRGGSLLGVDAAPVSAGGGGIALVAHAGGSGTSSSATTPAIDTTGANLLIAACSLYGTDDTTPTLTDSKANTWSALSGWNDTGDTHTQVRIYYCPSPTVGSGHTFTNTAAFPAVCVAAFSGAAASPFDAWAANGGSGSAIAAGPITPAVSGELCVAAVAWYSGNTLTINGGYTIADQVNYGSGNNIGVALAYLVESSIVVTDPAWTASNTFASAAAEGASFKPM